jgi:hypothetical protein
MISHVKTLKTDLDRFCLITGTEGYRCERIIHHAQPAGDIDGQAIEKTFDLPLPALGRVRQFRKGRQSKLRFRYLLPDSERNPAGPKTGRTVLGQELATIEELDEVSCSDRYEYRSGRRQSEPLLEIDQFPDNHQFL